MPPYKKETMEKFQAEIEEIVYMKDVSVTEAILMFCEEHDFEIERIPRILSNSLKSQLEEEAQALNLLKEKDDRLPI